MLLSYRPECDPIRNTFSLLPAEFPNNDIRESAAPPPPPPPNMALQVNTWWNHLFLPFSFFLAFNKRAQCRSCLSNKFLRFSFGPNWKNNNNNNTIFIFCLLLSCCMIQKALKFFYLTCIKRQQSYNSKAIHLKGTSGMSSGIRAIHDSKNSVLEWALNSQNLRLFGFWLLFFFFN